jgi:hypothetical protein
LTEYSFNSITVEKRGIKMAKVAKKTIKGVLGGAYCSSDYDYPTHSLVYLTNKDIKRILAFMDKLKSKDLKDVHSLTTEIGNCSWFRVINSASNYGIIAEALGVSADDLSNMDSDSFVPVTTDWKYFWGMKDENDRYLVRYLVDVYSSGGVVHCVISRNSVYWKGYETHSGSKMESPCFYRKRLEKWLKGDFT